MTVADDGGDLEARAAQGDRGRDQLGLPHLPEFELPALRVGDARRNDGRRALEVGPVVEAASGDLLWAERRKEYLDRF